MRPANLWRLYRVRLRARLLQECFAVVGIAAGVALLFSSQVASSSLLSSVAQLSRGIVGRATVQLLARDSHGMPEAMLARVRGTPGVKVAAALFEAPANAVGPRGADSVQLIGADESLAQLGGALVRSSTLAPFAGIGAIALPSAVAQRIGVRRFGQEATLQLDGRSVRAPLYSQLRSREVGALASSPIAVAPLAYAQQLAGQPGRVTRTLVQPARGHDAQVRAALVRRAAGRLNVEGIDYDERLFSRAATASEQSTTLFAAISALVGFLFAFNAMLLTVPQRRRLIASLRRDGYEPRTVIAVLLLDALVLGASACVLGLALGEELSLHLFGSNPGYLSSAFAVGSQRVVGWQSVLVAVAGGMLAAIVAVLSPLRDILSRDPLAAIAPRERAGSGGAGARAPLAGLVCLGAALAIALAAPQAAIVGTLLLVVAMLLCLPAALGLTLALVRSLARRIVSATPHVAAMELGAARSRAVAIVSTGAIAVFGSVAIQGAHGDLLAGLDNAARDMNAFANVWVSPAGGYNLLKTAQFTPTQQARLERAPGVRAARVYRGALFDLGTRRVWVIAPPADADPLVPPSQLVDGAPGAATRRVRGGGWLVLSRALADERHLRIGESFTLPSPRPRRFAVAALSTNIGWPSGAIVMSAADFARAWGSDDAAAYDVLLDRGAEPRRVEAGLQVALGPGTGLTVESATAHAGRQRSLSRQGLARLSQIAILIVVGAVLAMAAAIGTMVWQRRPRLAKLRLEGFSRGELWRTVLLESALLLAAGCATGAVFGLLGQQLLDRALSRVVDLPVVYSVALGATAVAAGIVLAAAVAAVALPGYLAANVPPARALQD